MINLTVYSKNILIKTIGCLICFGGRNDKTYSNRKSRYVKFSAAEIEGTPNRNGKPQYSMDPLQDFMKFLLFETNKKYRNIVYSHFGGRYDSGNIITVFFHKI